MTDEAAEQLGTELTRIARDAGIVGGPDLAGDHVRAALTEVQGRAEQRVIIELAHGSRTLGDLMRNRCQAAVVQGLHFRRVIARSGYRYAIHTRLNADREEHRRGA